MFDVYFLQIIKKEKYYSLSFLNNLYNQIDQSYLSVNYALCIYLFILFKMQTKPKQIKARKVME